jgi:hypothetical protein
MYLPNARRKDLTVRELAEETVIYDHKCNKAHCLNRTTAFIWRQCDGSVSVEYLVERVRKELNIGQAGPVVQLALEQLSRRDLLLQPVPSMGVPTLMARRAVLKRLAAAASLPLVLSVSARAARGESVVAEASCGAICLYDANGQLKNTIVAGATPTAKCQVRCPSTGPANSSSIIQGRLE